MGKQLMVLRCFGLRVTDFVQRVRKWVSLRWECYPPGSVNLYNLIYGRIYF